jgi:HK97 family phage portal protein
MFISSVRAGGFDRSPWGDFYFAPLQQFSRGGLRVTPATALGLPTVYSCIKVIAESFAVMPFVLYQDKAGGGRTRNKKHWLYRLFAKAPNRFQTPFEWRLMLMGHLALRGNAFCQISTNSRGEIVELLPLHPDRMAIEPLDNGSYRYVYTDGMGRQIRYARQEIWHLRGLSDDGYMGLSPIGLARDAIAEGLSIQAYSSRFFANDARPGGGWIEYPHRFADTTAKKTFRDTWQEMQGGANRGKVAVLEAGMKYHELGLNNKESQFIEARAAKKSEIASIWRVPPHKIGDLSDATYSNIEQQAIEFWTDCMLPYAELWESSIEYFLLGADDALGLEPEFDMARMMRGDTAARAEYITKLVQAGVLTRNEGREIEGYDPIEGLDEPLRPLNMVEESAADDDIEPPAPSRRPGAAPEDDDEEDGSADARRRRSRARKAAALAAARSALTAAATARVQELVRGNAARMARRIAGGRDVPGAETLAEALAITPQAASGWLAAAENWQGTEQQITASLVALGETA